METGKSENIEIQKISCGFSERMLGFPSGSQFQLRSAQFPPFQISPRRHSAPPRRWRGERLARLARSTANSLGRGRFASSPHARPVRPDGATTRVRGRGTKFPRGRPTTGERISAPSPPRIAKFAFGTDFGAYAIEILASHKRFRRLFGADRGRLRFGRRGGRLPSRIISPALGDGERLDEGRREFRLLVGAQKAGDVETVAATDE